MEKQVSSLTIRLSPEMHKKIKQRALDKDLTVKDYIVELVLRDLRSNSDK
ncbi:hypothetical protein HCA78_07655 [Listeria booriae]|uniref:Toxin-antitoxin system HicB family antitoxin n=1 Tax=Listeria booriae TaxID=1552123 RepID=A0A842CUN9_9LIST|nr:hypothetical protein [Listeria booriae]MBC2003634.1 hypothetical protein [Listeria booriae]